METAAFSDGSGAAALRAFIALIVVVAAIIATAWLARRLRVGTRTGSWFHIRAAHALGPRDRVLLVEAAGAHLLLSVSSGGVRVLHAFDEAPPLPAAVPAPSLSRFADVLSRKRREGDA